MATWLETEMQRIENNARLADPTQSSEAVAQIVREELLRAGLNVDSAREQEQAARQRAFADGKKFVLAHPGFIQSKANEQKIFDYISERGLNFDLVGFEHAYAALKAEGLLDLKVRAQRPERTSPRTVAGIRITHEALDELSAEQMQRLMMNPEFVSAVNALGPR